jgi:hypothetical protein
MKWTYRISTIIFSVAMLLTAITDITRMDSVMTAIRHLGYPDFLPWMIGTGKLIGVVLLSIPRYSRLKEWAYAGFTILFISAAASHAFTGYDSGKVPIALVMEGIVLLSYISMLKTIGPLKVKA